MRTFQNILLVVGAPALGVVTCGLAFACGMAATVFRTRAGQDPSQDFELLGYRWSEVNEFAFKSLTRRLKAIGAPLEGAPAAA